MLKNLLIGNRNVDLFSYVLSHKTLLCVLQNYYLGYWWSDTVISFSLRIWIIDHLSGVENIKGWSLPSLLEGQGHLRLQLGWPDLTKHLKGCESLWGVIDHFKKCPLICEMSGKIFAGHWNFEENINFWLCGQYCSCWWSCADRH